MTEAIPPIDDDDAALAELVAKDLAAVRHVHAQLMAATQVDDVNTLGRTYQRVARSLRQSLALKAKLKREAAQDAAAAAPKPPSTIARILREDFVERRLEAIQDGVCRVIDAACVDTPERRAALYDRFDREMDDWNTEDEWFLTEVLDEQVAQACDALDLDLDLAFRWRKLPRTDWGPDPAEAAPEPHADTG